MAPFPQVWQEIRDRLSVRVEVPYWGRVRAKEGMFRIERVNYDEVPVSGQGIAGIRSASRRLFERFYDEWENYKNNDIKRTELGSSRQSSYILSIFKWLEDQKANE
jgi:hypothetical protein